MTDTPRPDPARPAVANADRPSETAGLPGVGEGASASHFARDAVEWQAGEGRPAESQAPADVRDHPKGEASDEGRAEAPDGVAAGATGAGSKGPGTGAVAAQQGAWPPDPAG